MTDTLNTKLLEAMEANMAAAMAARNGGADTSAATDAAAAAATAPTDAATDAPTDATTASTTVQEASSKAAAKRVERPLCLDAREGCIGHRDGRCIILDDTEFGEKPCPFYKTKQQAYDDRAWAYVKMKEGGGQYLIDTYGNSAATHGDSFYLASFAEAEEGTYARKVYDEYSALYKEARYARTAH